MKVRDIMTAKVVSVREDTPFAEVARTMLDRGVSGVPVIDATGAVVGVISDTDLLAKEAYPTRVERRRLIENVIRLLAGPEEGWHPKAAALTARELMDDQPVTAQPDESVHRAAARMVEYHVKRLPVVEEGKLVGILTQRDVLRVFTRSDADLRSAVERFLLECLYAPPDAEVAVSAHEGIVTLEGVVELESDVRVIGNLIASMDGVVGVENRLSFRERDPRGVTV
jgi:CBS domain-containing protein